MYFIVFLFSWILSCFNRFSPDNQTMYMLYSGPLPRMYIHTYCTWHDFALKIQPKFDNMISSQMTQKRWHYKSKFIFCLYTITSFAAVNVGKRFWFNFPYVVGSRVPPPPPLSPPSFRCWCCEYTGGGGGLNQMLLASTVNMCILEGKQPKHGQNDSDIWRMDSDRNGMNNFLFHIPYMVVSHSWTKTGIGLYYFICCQYFSVLSRNRVRYIKY